jgi:hypothetical protein
LNAGYSKDQNNTISIAGPFAGVVGFGHIDQLNDALDEQDDGDHTMP